VALPTNPTVPTSPSDQSEGSPFGAAVTVKVTVIEFVRLPDVPVTVTVAVPVVAVLLAVRVRTLEVLAGFVLNEAVTPLGKPEADKATVLPKPFCGVTEIVLVPLAPCVMLTLFGDEERRKVGVALTVTETVVLAVKLPDVPVTVTIAVPVAAELLAVRVSTLDAVAGFVPNDAVTPLGKPEAEKVTPPLNPFCGVTVMVLAPLPACGIITLLGDADKL
jgi:hypothetical protein